MKPIFFLVFLIPFAAKAQLVHNVHLSSPLPVYTETTGNFQDHYRISSGASFCLPRKEWWVTVLPGIALDYRWRFMDEVKLRTGNLYDYSAQELIISPTFEIRTYLNPSYTYYIYGCARFGLSVAGRRRYFEKEDGENKLRQSSESSGTGVILFGAGSKLFDDRFSVGIAYQMATVLCFEDRYNCFYDYPIVLRLSYLFDSSSEK